MKRNSLIFIILLAITSFLQGQDVAIFYEIDPQSSVFSLENRNG